MRILDPGHKYELEEYDGGTVQIVTFMKREGPGYPMNVGHNPGINCQEALRMIIDRMKYLDKQIHCDDNERAITNLRRTFLEFERRASIRHGAKELEPLQLWDEEVPVELVPHCRICGHIQCFGHH
jgi:hypothetical protein